MFSPIKPVPIPQEVPPPQIIIDESYIKTRIKHYADFYGVSEITMNYIVKCESNYNPKARNLTPKEDSNGLVQINLKAHDIPIEKAQDVEFSLDFLASHLKKGNGEMWFNCWTKR